MLELKNINYEVGEKKILSDISLKIDDRFVAVTGPNGSGKSTLAKLIMGIIQPTSGRICFDGEDVTELGVTERAKRGISFAFQQPVRFKGITVKDMITLSAGKEINVGTACAYLSEVGLCAKDYVDREINASLSGGELKRIEIAMINARSAKFSIFDEPEAGIDLWSFNSLIKVFQNMYERTKGNIMIISHQERILQIADKIVLLNAGRLQEYGDGKDILPKLLNVQTGCYFTSEKGGN